ncbi:YcxB family protein [Microbacterium sp.]|uniref:YcxB family protein n=1 Tax=Microbacterium sp. TaxID=51671 RepID=UPI0039E289D9
MTETRFIIADDRMPSRLAGAYVKWQLTRPSSVVLFSVVSALTLGASVFAAITGNATLLLPILLWLVVMSLFAVLTFTMVRASCRSAYPPGADLGARVNDETLWVQSATGTSELRLSALTKVFDRPAVVILKTSSLAGGATILPRELFTDEDIARLQAAAAPAAQLSRRR